MVNSAMTVAISTLIGFMPVFRLPFGGSVTIGKLIPVVFFSFNYGCKAGMFVGLTCGIIKMILMFHVPPVKTFSVFAIVVLSDYLIPYVLTGAVTGVLSKRMNNKKSAIIVSLIFSNILRFICLFISGVVVWNQYIPNQYNIWIYSLIYNLIYIVPETLISLIVGKLLMNFLFPKKNYHTF